MDGLRCSPCQVGFFSAARAKQCAQCPAGTISVATSDPALASGASLNVGGNTFIYGVSAGDACWQCPAGYYQPAAGGHACLPCTAGRFEG